jgi:hypothetical protein
VTESLSRVTRSLGMADEPPNLIGSSLTRDCERNRHLLEIGRRVIDVVFLRVAKCAPNISGCVLDGNLIERREPRHLSQ